MLNKIYLITLAVFVVILGVLTFLAYDWLGSVSNPSVVEANYSAYLSYGRMFLFISTLALLILANIIFWKTRQTWTFWATLIYFVVFILIQNFWLDGAFNQFQIDKKMSDSTFSPNPLVGVLLCVAAGIFVFFNQFLIKRMHDRMFASAAPLKELSDDAEITEVAN